LSCSFCTLLCRIIRSHRMNPRGNILSDTLANISCIPDPCYLDCCRATRCTRLEDMTLDNLYTVQVCLHRKHQLCTGSEHSYDRTSHTQSRRKTYFRRTPSSTCPARTRDYTARRLDHPLVDLSCCKMVGRTSSDTLRWCKGSKCYPRNL
jgi:hypothetical protein